MFRPGDLVDGRFVLERIAGAGGRAAVWRAVDVARRDAVALKLVPGERDADPLATVRGEIDALATVHHEAVVACRGFGRADPRTAYLALSWIDGEPLSARIARRPLTVAAALTLGRRICDALGAIHEVGLIHGDLKPANVILPGGDPAAAVVVDLGIARAGTRAGAAPGEASGTPAHMAPEQARGDAGLDGRVDLFALGTVLYEALAGRPAFAGDSATAVLSRVLFEAHPPLPPLRPDAPDPLVALIDELLAKDRQARPNSAAAVRARLGAIPAPAGESPVAVGGDEVRPETVVVAAVGGDAGSAAVATRRLLGASIDVAAGDGVVVIRFAGSIATDRAIAATRAAAAVQRALGAPVGVAGAVDEARRLAGGGGLRVEESIAELVRADGQRTVLGRPTPLVGRDRELAMLTALADECEAEQAPRVALITAAPGLGKSRLRRELVRRLDGRFEAWLGRGDPVRAGAPLGALADLIRASIDPGPLDLDRAALRVAAGRRGVGGIRRVADFLGELLGLPDDGDPPAGNEIDPQLAAARADPILMNDQLRRAVIDWLDAAAARRPLALVLEDFHWGDAATARFLDASLRQLRERPILVVALGRPAMLEVAPDAYAAHHPLTVRLGPLSARAAGQLVRHALPALEPAVVDRLVERGAGNPFYVEELVRQVAAGHEELPATVVSMVQARLDDLDPAERRVLRAAAVLGSRFSRAAVAALLGLPSADRDLEGWLHALVGRELLLHRRSSAVAAEDELGFAHDLVREAAGALLTADDRSAAHRAAAIWWEQRAGADPVVLASHWERGGAPARAATWQRRAAEVALAANDFAAALAALRRADELGAPPSATADLLRAEAHGWRGALAESAAAAGAAMEHAGAGELAWWRGLGVAVTARGRLGDHDAVFALAELAFATAPAADAVTAYLSCLAAIGRQLFHTARYLEARRAIALVIEHAGDVAALPPLVAAQVHGMFAAAARHRGDLGDDLAGYRAVLADFVAAGDLRNATNTRVSVAFALIELGDWDPAEAELVAALGDAERLGLAPVATRARQNLGLVYLHRRRLAEAAALLDQVIGEAREQENARFEGWTRVYRARVALAAGDPEAARDHARAAIALLDASPPALAGARAVWSQILVALGRTAEAVTEAREAAATVDELGGIEEFETLVRLALAEALSAAGDRDGAAAAIARATARIEERAAAIGDPALRARFRTDVEENRRTLQLTGKQTAAPGVAPR